MKEIKASTKRGQELIKTGSRCCWNSLHDIYNNWSQAKENAYNWCYDEYLKTENRTGFGVGNANTSGFTASWLGTINNENIMRVETKSNSYLIWLDR